MLRIISILTVMATVLLFGFQNCSEVGFSEDPAAKAALVAMEDTQNTIDETQNDFDTSPPKDDLQDYPPSQLPPTQPEQEGQSPDDHYGHNDDTDTDEDSDEGSNKPHDPDDKNCRDKDKKPKTGNTGGLHYVCILDGPGKSHLIGLVNDALTSQISVPQAVCMSKTACTEIVAKAFHVKMAHKRGFCPNKNPHVIALSDDAIENLVQGLLATE